MALALKLTRDGGSNTGAIAGENRGEPEPATLQCNGFPPMWRGTEREQGHAEDTFGKLLHNGDGRRPYICGIEYWQQQQRQRSFRLYWRDCRERE